MKSILKYSANLILASGFMLSCNKSHENSNQSTLPPNPAAQIKRPSANAGQDISVNYDLQNCKTTDSIILNGSASFDPDGIITSYLWKGPGLTAAATSPVIKINNLSPGHYKFVLLVTNDKGFTDTDTVVVDIVSLMNRGTINVELLPFGFLSQPRAGLATAVVANKILFAGGYNPSIGTSTRVDIYDLNTSTWSIAELSQPRNNMAVAVLGTKVFFAGGSEGGWWDGISTYPTVDIYDASSNTWSTANLAESRGWIAAAVSGNKVFFAGGVNQNYINSNKVDVYDLGTNSWSTASLSSARHSICADAINDKIYFAGGWASDGLDFNPSATIDIYDNSTGGWSVSTLNEPKSAFQSVAIGNKVIWAGGVSGLLTGQVEIKDVNTLNSSFACLYEPIYVDHVYRKAVTVNNKVLFINGYVGNNFDIYDLTSNTWYVGKLNKELREVGTISVNNTIYVSGGYIDGVLSNQVWKVEF